MATISIDSIISIAENPQVGAVIATLSVEDGAEGETFTYVLTNDFDDRFEIVGNEIRVKTATLFNFEAALNPLRSK
jgi:hypothetical protein